MGFVPSFKPGMSANVDIRTNTARNVVTIPIQSVTVRDFARDRDRSSASADTTASDSGNQRASRSTNEDFRRVVFVNQEGIAKRVEVETGISDNRYIQVMSGIDAGAEVITGNYRVLSRELEDGDAISIRNRN